MQNEHRQGFTLIELSIVLVIIGLIVGGVLVGQDLIRAAGVRATITQIEKYNTAVNTFRGKYGGLPGDLNAAAANQFGFVPRGTQAGEGDGNGLLEGNAWYTGGSNSGFWECAGETSVFWVDLSQALLIDGTFNTASETTCLGTATLSSTPGLNNYLPQAKIGRGNYFYIWSGGWGAGNGLPDGRNYFGLAAVQWIGGGSSMVAQQGLTVQEAYSIDKKVDDGMPQTGNVTALYVDDNDFGVLWASADAQTDDGAHGVNNVPITGATPYSPINCYDNNNVAGAETYSLAQNASMVNCALSFVFQ